MATQSDVDQSGILTEQETSKEPSKMSPDEKLPMTENEAPTEVEQVSGQAIEPSQDVPLTKERFSAQIHLLTERARAAGLNPIYMLAQTYAKQGMVILEGLLASLENEDSSKKKKK